MYGRAFKAVFPDAVTPSIPRNYLANADSDLPTQKQLAREPLQRVLPDATVKGVSYVGSYQHRVDYLTSERGPWIRVARGSVDPSGPVQDASRQG